MLDDYMNRFNVPENEIVKKRSALIPSLRKQDLKEHQISGENWALVGDAAALAEPITGEGIYYAVYSSWLFADCLKKVMIITSVGKRVQANSSRSSHKSNFLQVSQ